MGRRLIGGAGGTDDDAEALDRTEAAVRESFAVIADGLRRDCLDDLIECELVEESFRRFVR